MRGSRTLRLVASVLVLLGSLSFIPRPAEHVDASEATSHLASGTPNAAPTRLLVIVPHPDDASLVAAGLIEQVRRQGGLVRLAVMTNGDGFRLAAAKALNVAHPGPHDLVRLGLLRQREELAAARELGVAERDVLFLGYPDGGLQQLFSSAHWTPDAPFRGMNGATHVPYPLAYRTGAPYCGQAVVDDLRGLIGSFQPTDVLYPDAHDIHNDHAATSAFLQTVLGTMEHPPRAHTYLVHYAGFPMPRHYAPHLSLEPPQALVEADSDRQWHRVPLDADQIACKKGAILAHRSQMQVMSDLLLSFVRTNDLFADATTQVLGVQPDGQGDPFAKTSRSSSHVVVLRDPPDEKLRADQPGGDIRAVEAVRSGDRLLLCLEASGPIRTDLTYRVHLRWLGVPSFMQEKFDFTIRSGKLSNRQNHHLHPLHSEQPTVVMQKNRLLLTLPSPALRRAQALLIGAESLDHQHLLDRTAWQTLRIESFSTP